MFCKRALCFLQDSPIHSEKSPINLNSAKEPYISAAKETYILYIFCKRALHD